MEETFNPSSIVPLTIIVVGLVSGLGFAALYVLKCYGKRQIAKEIKSKTI
jgi:hypothetical protein